jgi:hypothetical protein
MSACDGGSVRLKENRMKHSMIFAGRLQAFAVLVWIGSACGGNISVPAPLLAEGFNGAFPGVNWTAPAKTGAGVDPSIIGTGNPSPGLQFAIAAPTGTVTTTTTASFNNPNLTISMQEAVTSITAGLIGSSTISILDSTLAVVATATWNNATSPSQIVYSITGTTLPPITAPASDGVIHTFKFNVDASGNATWALDGGTTQTKAAFPAGMLKVQLNATFGTGASWPTFLFDNVMVTSP